MLAIEERFPTACFPFRLFCTVLGMTFGNSFTAFNYFVRPYNGGFLEFINELCYDGMLNNIDAIDAATAMPTAAAADPAEDRRPGMPSPYRSPTRAAAQHKLGPIRLLPSYIGGQQQKCSVCEKAQLARLCCTHCSTADKIMVLCDPNIRPDCYAAHKADPEDKTHRWRRPNGLKRKRGSAVPKPHTPAAAAAASSSGVGSRSGASSTWDPRAFPPRKRPQARTAATEEEEDSDEA
eukprot:6295050-Prymnesium_polylepis.2